MTVAQQIAAGQWIDGEASTLYPYFLGVVYSVAGHSVWSARWLQAVLGSLACVLFHASPELSLTTRLVIAGLLLAVIHQLFF